MKLPLSMDWNKAQTRWASIINPVIALPPSQGTLLQNISLASGSNVINHMLGKIQQGWIVTDLNSNVTLYRSAPFNDKTLTLTSSGAAIISLWVY